MSLVTHFSLNLTGVTGADDSIVGFRIVPDGREGNVFYVRSLRDGEVDDGRGLEVDFNKGERCSYRPGALIYSIADVDRISPLEKNGYRPVENTIWLWLQVPHSISAPTVRYLIASARRLDAANVLLLDVQERMANLTGRFAHKSRQIRLALSLAELVVVALHRAVTMLTKLPPELGINLPLPDKLGSNQGGVKAIRDALEHIEDRAFGRARYPEDGDPLSIFDQRSFLSEGALTYGKHKFVLGSDGTQTLLLARKHLLDIVVSAGGAVRVVPPEDPSPAL